MGDYNPGITYHGDNYIYSGLNSFGANVGQALQESMKKQDELRKQTAYNDAIIAHAAQNKLIGPDELDKYQRASLTQKTGIAAGYAANIAADLARQNAQASNLLSAAQAANLGSETSARNQITPAQIALHTAQQKAAEAEAERYHADSLKTAAETDRLWKSPEGVMFKPTVYTLNDPNGKPFSVYSRGPNQVDLTPGSQGANLPAAGSGAYSEDGTQIGIWNAKGTITKFNAPKSVDPLKEAIASQITGVAPPAAAAPAAPKQLSAADQQAVAWAQANPKDPRAIAILKKNGLVQ